MYREWPLLELPTEAEQPRWGDLLTWTADSDEDINIGTQKGTNVFGYHSRAASLDKPEAR